MGFRLYPGMAGLREGLTPDLAAVGKAIGSSDVKSVRCLDHSFPLRTRLSFF